MIYIIVLNYNNWKDTIECLESLFKLKRISFKIIVCDNKSTNDSMENIKKWADGSLKIKFNITNPLFKDIIYPLEKKPLSYISLRKKDLFNNINIMDKKLILIENDENKGYSAGNNVGIQYALKQNDCKYVWILNNDTIVDNLSLFFLTQKMEKNPFIGICGTKTLFYYEPNKIQCEAGFYYNKWLAYPFKKKYTVYNLSYINGASMLVSKDFLNNIGLLCEDYFLYYEEIDWAIRAKQHYQLGYSPQSIIYHKEGGSINKDKKKSLLSDFYAIRNRILVTKKFYKYCLPTVYLGIGVAIINRIRRKQYKRAWMFIKILCLFGKCEYKDFKE